MSMNKQQKIQLTIFSHCFLLFAFFLPVKAVKSALLTDLCGPGDIRLIRRAQIETNQHGIREKPICKKDTGRPTIQNRVAIVRQGEPTGTLENERQRDDEMYGRCRSLQLPMKYYNINGIGVVTAAAAMVLRSTHRCAGLWQSCDPKGPCTYSYYSLSLSRPTPKRLYLQLSIVHMTCIVLYCVSMFRLVWFSSSMSMYCRGRSDSCDVIVSTWSGSCVGGVCTCPYLGPRVSSQSQLCSMKTSVSAPHSTEDERASQPANKGFQWSSFGDGGCRLGNSKGRVGIFDRGRGIEKDEEIGAVWQI